MNELAITVIGHDRTGIIADVAEALAGLGMNLTDSTMTRLRGHFAMTLICNGAPNPAEVEAALEPLTAHGAQVVSVRQLQKESRPEPSGGHFVVTLHGADRLGIVATATRAVAGYGGNVTDFTTRLSGALYVLVAEIDLPARVNPNDLASRLDAVATSLGVEIAIRPADVEVL